MHCYVLQSIGMAFSPLETKKKSTGAIEVSIGMMSKQHRQCTEEIYMVGFVPSYDLPGGRPNSMDPFLKYSILQ